MASRINVPAPDQVEERRQLAEAAADLHYVMSLLSENATEFIPGEAVDEFALAWEKSEESMRILVERLLDTTSSVDRPAFKYATLESSQLTGEVGKAKRSFLRRLMDPVLMYFNSEPRTDDKRRKAAEAATGYFEFGATFLSSLPGHQEVVEVLSLGKQLLGIRAKRGI